MRRSAYFCLAIALAATVGASPSPDTPSSGNPYGLIGEVAVQHLGRVKPLDTYARLQVKEIVTRETIKIADADGKTTETWEPMAALLDWRARPEFWEDKEFIAFEYLPLKQKLISIPARELLTQLSKESTLAEGDRVRIAEAAKDPNVTSSDLKAAASLNGVPAESVKQLKSLAHKISPDQKWLSPDDLETGRIEVGGREVAFMDWLMELERRPSPRPEFDERPEYTTLEKKALEAGQKLDLYRALRDGNAFGDPRFDIQITPRPLNAAYLDFTVKGMTKYREFLQKQPANGRDRVNPLEAGLTPLELDAISQYTLYAKDLKSRDRRDPGSDPEFDAAFVEWLREKSGWIPLRLLLLGEASDFKAAGFEVDKVVALRNSFEALLAAEKAAPAKVSMDVARSFVTAARDLGESVSIPYLLKKDTGHKTWSDLKADRVAAFKAVRDPLASSSAPISPEDEDRLLASARALSSSMVPYPSASEVQRETAFNSIAPFYKAQFAYGAALVLLLLSIGLTPAAKPAKTSYLESGLYLSGMAALIAGIGLEILGFYYRIRITGWAPVTNMYETVIWVALVTSGLGLILELIYRKKYSATAASGVALLATVLAANVSLLDADIKNLQPVLRSNYWLTIHVLTIVSSYAAFALSMGLGLLAVAYYLSATYRRDVPYSKLALPLLPGIPMLALGVYGLLASSEKAAVSAASTLTEIAQTAGPQAEVVQAAPYPYGLGFLALSGMVLSIVGLFGLIGEAASRASSKMLGVGLGTTTLGVAGLVARRWVETPDWWPSEVSLTLVPAVIAALGMAMVILSRLGAMARSTVSGSTESNTTGPASEYAAAFPAEPSAAVTRKPTAAEILARQTSSLPKLDPRVEAMQNTAARIKPLASFNYRAMQVGVLLVAAGTILGGVWADVSWGRFWGWDAKEVWALITLLVYLVPLHGRFAGWVNTFGLIASSVLCFASVMMAWYGVNFVLSTGLHAYGFVEGGGQGIVLTACVATFAVVAATWRRRRLASMA